MLFAGILFALFIAMLCLPLIIRIFWALTLFSIDCLVAFGSFLRMKKSDKFGGKYL